MCATGHSKFSMDSARDVSAGPGVSGRLLSALPPLVYMVLSATLSLLNRHLYNGRRPKFQLPALLITVQAVVVGLLTTAGLNTCWRSQCCNSVYWPSRIRLRDFLRLVAVAAFFSLDVALTQASLVLAPVAMVEVVKCLVPAVVLLELGWLLRQSPTAWEVASVAAVCLGVLLATQHGGGVADELEPGGLLLAVGSTAAAGTRLVASQVLLKRGAGEACPTPLLLGYMSPALLVTGGAAVLLFELGDISPPPAALQPPHLVGTVELVLLSSFLAFALNLSELWCISAGSAMALTLAGSLKTVLLVALSAVASGHALSPGACAGSLLAALGVAAFKARGSSRQGDATSERVEMQRNLVSPEAASPGSNAGAFG